jgi:hypothetical protein
MTARLQHNRDMPKLKAHRHLQAIAALALIELVCLSPGVASSGELYTISIKHMPYVKGPEPK